MAKKDGDLVRKCISQEKKKATYAEKCTIYVKKRPVRLKTVPVAVELLMISFRYDRV